MFGKCLKKKELVKLGFTKNTASHPTITQTIKRIDPAELEKLLGEILFISSQDNFQQIAIDGKSIRSTSKSKDGLVHLLSAYVPEIAGAIPRTKTKTAGGEIATAEEMVTNLDIKGKIITGDAMFAQEVLCSKITNALGDYLFKVKRNKKRIVVDIEQEFTLCQSQNTLIPKFEITKKTDGRVDYRLIKSIDVRRKYWGTNTIKRIARVTRNSFNIRSNSQKTETQYLISSILESQLSTESLLNLCNRHWDIENNLHRTRDTNFKEDVCNIICHKAEQTCAALRNLAIFSLNKIDSSITKAIDAVTLDTQRI